MSTFVIAGDPGSVRSQAAEMRARASTFVAIADGLASVSTSGWTGRAADRFRDRFDVEPGRWQAAGDGFFTAAGALDGWASTLSWAQERAIWCTGEWARGDQVTGAARAAYDADVRAAHRRADAWEAAYGQGTYTLTIQPFIDPGEAIRDNVQAVWDATLRDVEAAAAECASGVRAGCAAAPASRNWLETGLAAVGGFFAGAGEAIWDLGSMIAHLSFAPVFDLFDLVTGNLTAEEMAARNGLRIEQAQAMWNAFTKDPWEFGKEVGKAVLDWDTWTDDPARALGHLVPDAIAAVATGGTAAALTRGASASSKLLGSAARLTKLFEAGADLAGDFRLLGRLDSVGDIGRWTGDGGRALTATENAAAELFLDGARRAEPKITGDIAEIAARVGADTPGLDFRLKGADSFKRKFADELTAADGNIDTAARRMNDSVRYTYQLPGDAYADGVGEVRSMLSSRGYEEVRWKNTWGEPGYQAINSTWRTPDGSGHIEVQFHTPESMSAKMSTHDLYEQQRLLSTGDPRLDELVRRQAETFDSVPLPVGADLIGPRVSSAHRLAEFLKWAPPGGAAAHLGVSAERYAEGW